MKDKRYLRIGSKGEKVAANYLLAQGYKIITANFFNDRGYRWGEIDLVAEDKDGSIVFVEVKTRKNFKKVSNDDIAPEVGITPLKIRRLKKVVNVFLQKNELIEREWRIDAIGVIFNYVSRKISIKHIKFIRE